MKVSPEHKELREELQEQLSCLRNKHRNVINTHKINNVNNTINYQFNEINQINPGSPELNTLNNSSKNDNKFEYKMNSNHQTPLYKRNKLENVFVLINKKYETLMDSELSTVSQKHKSSRKDSKLPFIRNEAVFSSKVNLRESVSLTELDRAKLPRGVETIKPGTPIDDEHIALLTSERHEKYAKWKNSDNIKDYIPADDEQQRHYNEEERGREVIDSYLDNLLINNYNINLTKGSKISDSGIESEVTNLHSSTQKNLIRKIRMFTKNSKMKVGGGSREKQNESILMSRNRSEAVGVKGTHERRCISVTRSPLKNLFFTKAKKNCDVCAQVHSRGREQISQKKTQKNSNLSQIYGESRIEMICDCLHANPKDRNPDSIYKVILELKRLHLLFSKLSFHASKEIFNQIPIIRVKTKQYLFKQGYKDSSVFLIIYGKIVMTSKYFGVIGVLKMADTIGEDVIFAQAKTRTESCYAESDACLLDFSAQNLANLKIILYGMGLKNDFILLNSHFRKIFNKKKAWKRICKERAENS